MPSHPGVQPKTRQPAATSSKQNTVPPSHAMLEAIMRDNNRRLYRFVRSMTASDSDAEDIVQETYLRAFRAMDGFDGRANLSTWLIRIAINVTHNRRRKSQVSEPIDDIDNIVSFNAYTNPRSPMTHAAPTPEQSAAQDQIRRYLESAVDQLPEEFRTVFMLRAVEEFSIEETAAALDIRPETVKTRLHRAKHRLRALLDDDVQSALQGIHPFGGSRCDRIVARVLLHLTPPPA